MGADAKPSCGWLLTRNSGADGPGDAIILGPDLRKVDLNISTELITQWVRDAPRKATIWTDKQRKLFPRHRLLVVLERWTTPTWTRVSWDQKNCDITRSALGLLPTNNADAPRWMFLALPGQTSTSRKIGNAEVGDISLKF